MKKYNFYLLESYDKKDFLDYVSNNEMLKKGIEILTVLAKYGKAYIVGGAVRDIVLGKTPKDIDIATNVPIAEIDKLFSTYEVGNTKSKGIVMVRYKDENFDIAQFRKDGSYVDGRRPETVEIVPSFEEDAARRDFTINAMALDKDGNIIDYFDGQGDLKNKVLKTVGNPDDRFNEDHLRMLRAIRISSRLGLEMSPDVKSAIKRGAHKITQISFERIRDELLSMASQKGTVFADAILFLDEVGLLNYILPEIVNLKEFKHNSEHHPEGGPYEHTLAALRANELANPIINLAILLHDIGKPKTYKLINDKHTYFGHAEESFDIIQKIAERLKLPTAEKNTLLFSAMNHMKIHNLLDMKKSKVFELAKNDDWDTLMAVSYCDKKARQGMFNQSEWDEIVEYVNTIMSEYKNTTESKKNIKKILDGNWVKSITGLGDTGEDGKKLGMIMRKTLAWIIDENIPLQDTGQIEQYILSLNS